MNLVELGAIGELVGGLAVVGSLVYVGIQIGAARQTFHLSSFAGVRDQLQIARLKKRKLLLRDQIAILEDYLIPDIIA